MRLSSLARTVNPSRASRTYRRSITRGRLRSPCTHRLAGVPALQDLGPFHGDQPSADWMPIRSFVTRYPRQFTETKLSCLETTKEPSCPFGLRCRLVPCSPAPWVFRATPEPSIAARTPPHWGTTTRAGWCARPTRCMQRCGCGDVGRSRRLWCGSI